MAAVAAAAAATGGYDDDDRQASSRVIRLAAGGDAWRGGPAGTPVHRSGAMCAWRLHLPAGCSGGRTLDPVRRCPLYMGYYLGEIFFDNCVNMNGAPRMRTPSRRSGARSCHAPGGESRMRSGCS